MWAFHLRISLSAVRGCLRLVEALPMLTVTPSYTVIKTQYMQKQSKNLNFGPKSGVRPSQKTRFTVFYNINPPPETPTDEGRGYFVQLLSGDPQFDFGTHFDIPRVLWMHTYGTPHSDKSDIV